MSDIDLKVSTRKIVNVRAKLELEDGTLISARSMARGIRLAVRLPNRYHPSEITVPEAAFEALEDIFIAVREAREEHAA